MTTIFLTKSKTKLYLKDISKKVLLTLSTLALLAGTLTAELVHAADGKDYPGTHCMPKDSDQVFVATVGGAMMNPSGSKTLTVICPGVNDAGTPVTGSVTVNDANPSNPVKCRLESRSRGGALLDGPRFNRTEPGEGTVTLSFSTPVKNQGNAYFYYVCDIPPAAQNPLRFSQITSYEFDEQ